MSRKATRRRVSVAGEEDGPAGVEEPQVRAVVRKKSRGGGLSFGSALDGPDDGPDRRRPLSSGGAGAAGLSFHEEEEPDHDLRFSRLRNDSLAKERAGQEPLVLQLDLLKKKEADASKLALPKFAARPDEPLLVLDLKSSKPQYDAEELDKLKRETQRLSHPAAQAARAARARADLIVVSGDQAEEVLMQQGGEGGGGGGGGEDDDDGDEGAQIPTQEQIRLAKERRERARARAMGEPEYIALDEDVTGGVAAPAGHDEEDDEGAHSRLVREREDDSDEPFEEHRGATIRFGAPQQQQQQQQREGPENAAENAAENEEWEREQLRRGAYDGAGAAAAEQEASTRAAMRRHGASVRAVEAATSFRPRPLAEVQQQLKRRVRDLGERCSQLQQQLASSRVAAEQSTADRPPLQSALSAAAATFDAVQRVREYALNLLDCLGAVAPQIASCEADLAALYGERGRQMRARPEPATWTGPSDADHEPDAGLRARMHALEQRSAQLLEDVVDEYASCRAVAARFEAFAAACPTQYRAAYVGDSLVDVLAPFAAWELLTWHGFVERAGPGLSELGWFQVAVGLLGDYSEEALLALLGKTLVPKLCTLVSQAYDASSRPETQRAAHQVEELLGLFQTNVAAMQPLLDAVVTAVTGALCLTDHGGGTAGAYGLLRVLHNGLHWCSVLPPTHARSLQAALSAYYRAVVLPLLRVDADLRQQLMQQDEARVFLETMAAMAVPVKEEPLLSPARADGTCQLPAGAVDGRAAAMKRVKVEEPNPVKAEPRDEPDAAAKARPPPPPPPPPSADRKPPPPPPPPSDATEAERAAFAELERLAAQ